LGHRPRSCRIRCIAAVRDGAIWARLIRTARARGERTRASRIGFWYQVVLTLLGIHAALAPGFALPSEGGAIVIWRQPIVGVLLIWFAVGTRCIIDPSYRTVLWAGLHHMRQRLLEYGRAGGSPPWTAALLLAGFPLLTIYLVNTHYLGTGDTQPALLTAHALLHNGSLRLDDALNPANPPYWAERHDGHWYSAYPLGPAVIAAPVVALSELLGARLDTTFRWRLERLIAATIAAASASVMLLILLRLADGWPAVLLTVLYGLGTPMWAVASQALWQHGPVALCVALLLLAEIRQTERRCAGREFAQGLLLGLAIICRPTVGLLVVLWLAYLFVRRPRALLWTIGGSLALAAPSAIVHLAVYGAVAGPYARMVASSAWGGAWALALWGNLVSPARGLLIYTPLAALAVVGPLLPRDGLDLRGGAHLLPRAVMAVLLAWVCLHLVAVSRFGMWWAGHCWGPRFLTELSPALIILAAPAFTAAWSRGRALHAASRLISGHTAVRSLFVAAIVGSATLQAIGIYSKGARQWCREPVNVDLAPERAWDWCDAPFLRPVH